MNNQYLFNVKYYDGLYDNDESTVLDANKKLINYELNSSDVPDDAFFKTTRSFRMQTVYPGLLIGTGNPHSSKNSSEEIKLGFTLDYTTGLPYIPGSTVKGVLRSVFKKPADNEREDIYRNRLQYIREIMAYTTGLDDKDEKLCDENINCFEAETFGDQKKGKGDIFFDAFPVRGDENEKLFEYEFITPHSPFKNPVPLRLLKVRPEVVYEFRFEIKDSNVIKEMTAEKKEELFKTIISDFGIGAKTNLGFGVMKATTNSAKQAVVRREPGIRNGKCIKCGRKIEEEQKGNYCEDCAKLRKKCVTHKTKKLEWDPIIQDWYCRECRKEGNPQ